MIDCVVIVPMLGRAEQVPRLVASLAASTDRARPLFVVTDTDTAVLNAVRDHDHMIVPPARRGDYGRKINTGITHSNEPLIFTGAIDLHFHPGWLDIAQAHLDERIQVVGTNDLTNERTAVGHSTHTLVTRDYTARGLIDGQKGLLCEQYLHEYVDDEMIGTAQRRRAYAHAPDAIVEHLHPMAGKAEWDATYLAMRDRMRQDRLLFTRRRQWWT